MQCTHNSVLSGLFSKVEFRASFCRSVRLSDGVGLSVGNILWKIAKSIGRNAVGAKNDVLGDPQTKNIFWEKIYTVHHRRKKSAVVQNGWTDLTAVCSGMVSGVDKGIVYIGVHITVKKTVKTHTKNKIRQHYTCVRAYMFVCVCVCVCVCAPVMTPNNLNSYRVWRRIKMT